MEIRGAIVFVTGANRGLGKLLVNTLKARGAAKIYASSRSGEAIPGTIPLQLDITKAEEIIAASRIATDTTLLINNAGINFNTPRWHRLNEDYAILELDIHYFETLAISQTFAPILGANGGGAIVNVAPFGRLSVPAKSSLYASIAALMSLSQNIRTQLLPQHTQVVQVMPVDSNSSKSNPAEQANPADIANAILDAVEDGIEELYPEKLTQIAVQQTPTNHGGSRKHFAASLS